MIFFYFFIIIISDFCWQADTHDVRQLKERKGKKKKGGGKGALGGGGGCRRAYPLLMLSL